MFCGDICFPKTRYFSLFIFICLSFKHVKTVYKFLANNALQFIHIYADIKCERSIYIWNILRYWLLWHGQIWNDGHEEKHFVLVLEHNNKVSNCRIILVNIGNKLCSVQTSAKNKCCCERFTNICIFLLIVHIFSILHFCTSILGTNKIHKLRTLLTLYTFPSLDVDIQLAEIYCSNILNSFLFIELERNTETRRIYRLLVLEILISNCWS